MAESKEGFYQLPGLEAKTVVVTGGARGIGRSIVWEFIQQNSQVAIIDVDEERGNELVYALTRQGRRALFLKCDVKSEQNVTSCMAEIAEYFCGIDILINNAGITFTRSFEELTVKDWERVIGINLTGAFICSKSVLRYMVRRGGGSIIMLSSGSAITGSGGSAAYAASKGGINSLIRSLSRELAPKGIRVNGVAPRSIQGELLAQLYTKEHINTLKEKIPLRRLGNESDVARVALFLASELAAFITGEVILVDGGRTYGV